ncbi:arginase [Thiospirochaeta perfilievii]|uniref:Arginase n=1 Tax=Thiospirochaeta perfilievii TaxID=252967 RepID=A0A5C1QD14_9SPIO|nr:arginase [Thiospirochaeta perfilievii]QEN04960.1 arginase [Thiospirochaeta perfilievii]
MNFRKIGLIGVPQDVGASKKGVDMGPGAIRVAGVIAKLRKLGHEVKDFGTVDCYTVDQFDSRDPNNLGLNYLDIILDTCSLLKDRVELIINAGYMPLVLGGDHSISIGTLAGLKKMNQGNTGVIWIDAHGDFNTAETSPTGNIHGMPLAIATGRGEKSLLALGPSPTVSEKNCVIIAAREIDPNEAKLLKESNVTVFTMMDVMKKGIVEIASEAIKIASDGVDHVHVSFDVDSLDPKEAPGTGTQVPGGLHYREVALLLESISKCNKVSSFELVEVNPALDIQNQTAELAVELLCHAFGKEMY